MKKIIITLVFFQLFSCQKNDKNTITNNSSDIVMEIPKCLNAQLTAGSSAEKSETDYPNYTFSETDLDCSVPLLEKELQKRSYKFPTSEEFASKVFEIFKRKIDYTKSTSYVYIDGNDACNKQMVYNKNSEDDMISKSYYLVKNKSFITELLSIPEITDYSKEFPESKKFEEQQVNNMQGNIKIVKWNEEKDLNQTRFKNIEKLVNRNLFLFNNRNEQLVWLLFNDENFLEILCKIYGYDKNDKINQHFIKKIVANNNVDNDILFFISKNCENKVSINQNFINSFNSYLTSSKKPNDALILRNIASRIMSDSKYSTLSKEEKIKSISYLANVYDPLFKAYHNEDANWGTLTILADVKDFYDVDWEEMKSIIIKNNYYNLNNLKMALEYAEEFDSLGAPD
jgi:hypothetical protein